MVYAIVRVSLDKDKKSTVRNSVLAPILSKHGFVNTKTGTWEAECTTAAALGAIAELTSVLEGVCSEHNGLLDHIWIMLDKFEPEDGRDQ